MRRLTFLVTTILLLAGAGCYEEHAQPQATPAPTDPSYATQPPQRSGDTPRPSHAAAKRAADNTVDRIQQHQQELEDAIDDQ